MDPKASVLPTTPQRLTIEIRIERNKIRMIKDVGENVMIMQ